MDHQCLCSAFDWDNHRHVKLLLALLAILTGFSVTDAVRVAEPAIAEGDSGLRGAWTGDDTRPNVAIAAALLVAAILPLVLASVPVRRWVVKPVPDGTARPVHWSDRLLQ